MLLLPKMPLWKFPNEYASKPPVLSICTPAILLRMTIMAKDASPFYFPPTSPRDWHPDDESLEAVSIKTRVCCPLFLGFVSIDRWSLDDRLVIVGLEYVHCSADDSVECVLEMRLMVLADLDFFVGIDVAERGRCRNNRRTTISHAKIHHLQLNKCHLLLKFSAILKVVKQSLNMLLQAVDLSTAQLIFPFPVLYLGL